MTPDMPEDAPARRPPAAVAVPAANTEAVATDEAAAAAAAVAAIPAPAPAPRS
jgi:hypothetical protein